MLPRPAIGPRPGHLRFEACAPAKRIPPRRSRASDRESACARSWPWDETDSTRRLPWRASQLRASRFQQGSAPVRPECWPTRLALEHCSHRVHKLAAVTGCHRRSCAVRTTLARPPSAPALRSCVRPLAGHAFPVPAILRRWETPPPHRAGVRTRGRSRWSAGTRQFARLTAFGLQFGIAARAASAGARLRTSARDTGCRWSAEFPNRLRRR